MQGGAPFGEQCSTHFVAHHEAITEAKRDIEKIYDLIGGVPQEVRAVKEVVSRLCEEMHNLSNKLENRYVSKEIFESYKELLQAQLKAHEERLSIIEDSAKWLFRGMATMAVIVIADLIKFLIKL